MPDLFWLTGSLLARRAGKAEVGDGGRKGLGNAATREVAVLVHSAMLLFVGENKAESLSRASEGTVRVTL